MKRDEIRIGLALSGGGIRATVMHMGVLKWLAEMKLFENIRHISTVSGASLCIGLLFSCHKSWPTSEEYLDIVLPKMSAIIRKHNIQNSALAHLAMQPWNLGKKSNVLARTIEKKWHLPETMDTLFTSPIWTINATTLETGKRFSFTREKMGDYIIGHSLGEPMKISNAIAASAAFPILIGLYRLDSGKYSWNRPLMPAPVVFPKIHLWDGGVYDNLGLEALYKIEKGGHFTGDLNFLLISNASAELTVRQKKTIDTKRLLDIAIDQVDSLRSRDVMDYLRRNQNGMYIKIGNSAAKILADSKASLRIKREVNSFSCLPEDNMDVIRHYPTTLMRPSKESFELLLRHGYENAKCVYTCYDTILKR